MPTSKHRPRKTRPVPAPPKSKQASDAGPVVVVRNQAHFEQAVIDSEVPVIVDFWATWCAPCRMMAPIFQQVATGWEGRVTFAKLDTVAVPAVAQALKITSIPTLLVFHKGEVIDARIGVTPAAALESVGPAKRRKLMSLARAYLATRRFRPGTPARIDVVAVTFPAGDLSDPQVTLVPDAVSGEDLRSG